MSSDIKPPHKVGRKYRLGKRLGSGSFGEVYHGTDVTSGEEVAVKLEKMKTRHPQLLYESKIYRALQGGAGVGSLKWFGQETHFNVLVTDLLGPSLEDLFTAMSRSFSFLTVMLIGEQMVQRIEYMHSKHFIHRDIKPDNFLSGRGRKTDLIYVIDFGLSKRYRHPKTKKHMAYREGKNLTGTPRYASINNHLGVEQSRRDDMESIGYVLIYFAKGELPWQGLRAQTKKQKYQKIMDKKMAVSIASLCQKVPVELRKYIEYCRSLRFEDKPNYPYLKSLFHEAAKSQKYGDPEQGFDWLKLKPRDKKQKQNQSTRASNRHARDTHDPRARPRQTRTDRPMMSSKRVDGRKNMSSMNNVHSIHSSGAVNVPMPQGRKYGNGRYSSRKNFTKSGEFNKFALDTFDDE